MQHLSSYFTGWHQIIEFDFFFPLSCCSSSCFNLTQHNLDLIGRGAEERTLCRMLERRRTLLCLLKRRYSPCMYFGLFIVLMQATNYATSTQKQPIQQISNGLSLVFFQASVMPFVYFLINQVKLQATHRSPSSVSRK